MKPLPISLSALLFLAGCASVPQPDPWQAVPMPAALPPACAGDAEAPVMPGGLGIIRSEGRDMLLAALRGCVMSIDVDSGAAELLPTHGDAIAPTMLDVASNGIAFSSSLSGSIRVIDPGGAISLNVSGLQQPRGLRLLPGGDVLVAEAGAGRVLRLGPGPEPRPRLVADDLDQPCGLLVADATQAFVTESAGGRLLRIRLDRDERQTIAHGLDQPQGIARMADGRLAVVEAGKQRLLAVDSLSGRIEVLASGLPILQTGGSAAHPHAVADVAVAPDGRLFISANATRTILELRPGPAPATR